MELAASVGFTGLEVAPFTLGPDARSISESTRNLYRKTAQSFGLEVIGLHWLLAKTDGYHLTTMDASIRCETAKYLCELARLCRDLGGNLMVLGSPLQRNFSPEMTHDQAVENAASVLEQCLPTLEQCQVCIAVEPLGPQEGNFLNRASQARPLIERFRSPWIRLHLDVKAMSSEPDPIDAIIREHQDLLVHFHANDPNRLGPGMGDVDFQPIFSALQEIGYEGWISVEVFDYSPGPEAIMRQSMDTMLAAL